MLPVPSLVEILSHQPFRFVLEGSRVNGIVTRADLQRVPVRIMAFGLVTLLEMHLRELVLRACPNKEWRDALSRARLDKAQELQAKRLCQDTGIGLLECIQLCDLREIVAKRKLSLGWTPQVPSSHLRDQLRGIEKFRDTLAHAQEVDPMGIVEQFGSLMRMVETISQAIRPGGRQ